MEVPSRPAPRGPASVTPDTDVAPGDQIRVSVDFVTAFQATPTMLVTV